MLKFIFKNNYYKQIDKDKYNKYFFIYLFKIFID